MACRDGISKHRTLKLETLIFAPQDMIESRWNAGDMQKIIARRDVFCEGILRVSFIPAGIADCWKDSYMPYE